ncbi:MAG TPA: autotransporter-associated beta strand repeat-containing protein [Pirellulales bacterium]|jgi:autotransporter-associated beta strand protein|nr:autotransporter-associated beta strand repeat-containing protein [Pirellulales bacterium]
MIRRVIGLSAIAVLASSALASTAAAQTSIFWNGTGTTWNSTADWWTTAAGTTPVAAFSGATIIANFNATGVNSAQTITLDASQVVQGIVFTGTDTGGETINTGAGTNTLTIGTSGIVDNSGSGADAFNSTLVLSAAQTWTNNSANTLSINSGVSLVGTINAATALTVNGSGATSIAGVLANGGGASAKLSLTYGGAGTLTLSNTNTYSGGTTLSSGTLTAAAAGALGTGSVTVSGGTLTESAANALNGATQALTVNGGSAILNFANTYGGTTTLSSAAAPASLPTISLDFSGAGAPATNIINNGVTITNNNITSGSGLALGGGTLRVTGSTNAATTNSQAFNGTTVIAGLSTLAINNSSGNTINLDLGTITRTAAGGTLNFMQPASGTNNFYTTTSNPTFTGGTNTILGGYAVFSPVGSATPTTWASSAASGGTAGLVTGLSSYTVANGSTAITAGADIDAQASPATVTAITINSLRFNTAMPVTITGTAANTITVASGGILETAAVGANAVTITGGNLTTGNGADLIVNQYNTASPLTVLSAVTGTTGVTLSGGGTLVLGGANTYTGGTRLNAGTLQLGDGTTNNSATYSGVISGPGGVVVNGPGTIAFASATALNNTYTGNTVVNGGTLSLGGNFGDTNTGTIRGVLTINAGGKVVTTVKDQFGYGPVGVVMNTVNINGGTLTLNIPAGSNETATGLTFNMTGGTIASLSTADMDFFNSNALGNTTLNTLATSTTAVFSSPLGLRETNPTITVAQGTAPGGIDLLVSGIILERGAGTGTLIKAGPGTMELSAANTFTRGLTISGGTVLLGNTLALQNSAATLSANNDLTFAPIAAPLTNYYVLGGLNGSANLALTDTSGNPLTLVVGGNNTTSTYGGALSGTGSALVKIGTGSFTLSNTNSYTGGTVVSAGTLVASNGLASLGGAGPLTVYNGATVVDGVALDQTFVNAAKNDANFFVLAMGASSSNNIDFSATGANLPSASLGAAGAVTYSGAFTPFGTSYIFGGGGGTLNFTGALSGSGYSLTKIGTGSTLALTTAATLTGPVTLSQGIINLNSAATFLNSSGVTLYGNSGESVTSAAPFAVGNVPLSGPVLFLNDGSGTTDHFGAPTVNMNGGSIELLSSGSTTIQNLNLNTQGQIVSAPSAAAGSAVNITNLTLGPTASATFVSQTGPIGSGTTNVGQVYITNLTQNSNPIALNNGTATMLGAGLTVQSSSATGSTGDGHTYYAAYGANGVTQLTGTTTTVGAGGNVVDAGETLTGTSFSVNSLVSQNANLVMPAGSSMSIASGGLIFGGTTHTIGPASAQTANITGGSFANNYTFYLTANNGGTDGATGYAFTNLRLTDNGGNPLTFVMAGSGTFQIGQTGTGGVGTATYTGPTIINGGVLRTNIGGGLGTLNATPTITVNAGGTLMGGAGDSFGFTANIDVITLNDGTITESSGTIRQTLWNTVTMNGGTITAPAGAGNTGDYSIDKGLIATSDAAGNPAVINAPAGIGLQNGNGAGTANPFTVNRGPGAVDLLISSAIFSFTAGNGISFNGGGITVLTANNTYTGVTNINSGTVRVGAGANAGSLGTGAVTDNGTLVYNRFDNITFANNFSGNGTLTQAGTDTLTLTGSLASFTGQTNINSGGLQFGDGVTTTGKMVQGSSIVDNGALIISYPSPNNQTYNGNISGSGSLTKNGSFALTFTQAHTYSGPTAINAGSLTLAGSSTGLGNTAIAVAAGASFSVHPGGSSITLGSTGTASAGASLALAAGTGANAGAAFDMVDGGIGTINLQQGSGFGSGLILGGAGASANAPSLSFEIGNSLGSIDLLAVTSAAMVGASGAKITIAGLPGATSLATGDYTFITASGGLGGAGFALASTTLSVGSHSYNLSLVDSTATSEVVTVTNSLVQPPNTAYWNGSHSGLWNTLIGGNTTNWSTAATSGADTQQLPGPLTNVFFTVTSGALNLSNTLGQDFSINSLNFTGTGTSATNPVTIGGSNTLTINGAAANGNTAGSGITVAAGSGAHTISSNVALGASQTWTNSSANLLTISGNIGDGGNGYVLTTAGQISLAGINTYSGGTIISSGVLTINADAALGAIPASPQTNLTFPANGGTLRAGGTPTLNVNRSILIASGVTASFDTNGNAMTIAGAITDADGTGVVAKVGAGVLTLSGVSSYGGGTMVTAGTLRPGVGGGASVFGASGSKITVAAGATLDYNGIPLNGGTAAAPTPDYPVFAAGAGVGGLGALVDNGPTNDSSVRLLTLTGDTTVGGTVRWGMRSSNDGNATLTGGGFSLTKVGASDFVFATIAATGNSSLMTGVANININAGRLVVANAATIDNTVAGSIFINTTGTLDLGDYTAGGAPDVFILKPIVMAGGTIVTDAASNQGNATIGAPISLNATGLINPQATSILTLSGAITDGTASNGITINGAGTVVLTGANAYSGVTTISAGTLQIDNGGTTGTLGTGNVVDNAALVFNRSDTTYTVPNAISGTGSLTHAGSGNLVLTGNLSYAGPTTITSGVLTLANPTTDETLKGAIGGGGSLVKSAANMVTLVNGGTFTGGTTINQGTLAIRSNTALGTANVTLAGGRLQLQAGNGFLTGRSIGVNFEGGANGGAPTSLLATDTAGVVPQANWNNTANAAGTTATVDSPVAGTIVDSSGAATPVTLTYASNNTYGVGQTITNGDSKLMNGYLDLNNANATTTSVALANLPYSTYNIYAYVGSDGNGRVGHGTVNGTSIFFTTNDNPFNGYVQATATTQAASANATYLLFPNVTGSSVTYTQNGNTNNVGLCGIQIVETTTGPITLANNLVVTADSTLDLTGFASGSITGSLSIGANTLSVTGGSTGANVPYTLNLGAVNLSGNATFNVANNGTAAGAATLGVVDDAGGGFGITKTGSGTLILKSPTGSTYAGATNVNSGTLLVANISGSATSSAAVTVASSGTLGVSAAFGAGTISGAVTVSGGMTSASIGSQTSASLTLANGLSLGTAANSSFTLNGTGANNTTNSNALIYVSGGTLSVGSNNSVTISGSPIIGVYDLYGYNSGPTSTANFITPAAPVGYAWSLAVSNNGAGIGSSNASANQLDLVITKVPVAWTGAVNGAWDTTTQNWAMGLPGVATTYANNDAVSFGDTNPINGNLVTNTAVAIQAGGVTPAAVSFTNTGAANGGVDYTVSGNLILPAGASLSKSGAGTATLTGAPTLGNNSTLAISGGTLRVSASTGSASVGTGVTATVSNSATLALSGSVSALGTATPGQRVNITTTSASASVTVTDSNQQVGGIDGPGTVRVSPVTTSASLTADHITAGALIIGGDATHSALVTIDASDSNGNPLDGGGFAIAGSLAPSDPFGAGTASSSSLLAGSSTSAGSSPAGVSLGGVAAASASLGGGLSAVPEPSSLVLLALGGLALLTGLRRSRR